MDKTKTRAVMSARSTTHALDSGGIGPKPCYKLHADGSLTLLEAGPGDAPPLQRSKIITIATGAPKPGTQTKPAGPGHAPLRVAEQPPAPASTPTLTQEQQSFLRKVARDRRPLARIIADAALVARMLSEQGHGLDGEVRLGLARSHDLLVLLAAAMVPKDRADILRKHEALAEVRPLDPAVAGLPTIVAAALSTDWRRLEEAKRSGAPDALGDLH